MSRRKGLALPETGYSVEEALPEIWVYLEQRREALASVSLELLGKAHELAAQAEMKVVGFMLGENLNALANEAIACGADEVHLLEDPRLAEFNLEAYTHTLSSVIQHGKPEILLLGATHDGRDLAGRLAVRLQTGLNADCTDLVLDSERGVLVSEVTGFGGGIIALLECPEHRPQMSTVRPGVFPLPEAESARQGEVIRIAINLPESAFRTEVIEREEYAGVDLTQAEILVCGGRGMEGDFEPLKHLAGLLGGEVGGTRPPVDDGFISRERQIGQTGVVCRPKIAICLGISGAFHFVVGIEKADLVIAVNTDPEAPIFEYADYCILADVRDFIPAFQAALQSAMEHAHA